MKLLNADPGRKLESLTCMILWRWILDTLVEISGMEMVSADLDFVETVDDLIKLACVLMKKRKSTQKDVLPYECIVTNAQARW